MSRYPGNPGKFLDNVETFLIICKLSGWYEKFLNSLKTIYTLFVAKTIYTLFCRKNDIRPLLLSQKRFTVSLVANTIYALHPETFGALKSANLKVLTFWASALGGLSAIELKGV